MAIDLYCRLGGWAEGFLSEGYDVIGFNIERHDYGTGGYPGQLVLQDVLTLHGSQFKDAAVIVASPPCQAYSYRAMPWKRAKALPPPDNTLFDACFRIQREAILASKCARCNGTGTYGCWQDGQPGQDWCPDCDASGRRYIPLIVENVKGAQPWVGRAAWHFGAYYLWGDVPALMPIGSPSKVHGQNWRESHKRGETSPCWNAQVVIPKGTGKTSWFFGNTKHELRGTSSGSHARKVASAQIAKIPFPLAQHIARCFK